MKINFWLNTPSPHLAGLIASLSVTNQVTVYSKKKLDDHRRQMGWQEADYKHAKFIELDRVKLCDELFKGRINVFSGLFSYRDLYSVTLQSMRVEESKTFVMMEKPNVLGIKGLAVMFKYRLMLLIWGRRLDGFLSLGATRFLAGLTMKSNVFSTAYLSDFRVEVPHINNQRTLAFVGQMVKRKNIKQLLSALKEVEFKKLLLVGEGPERENIIKIIDDEPYLKDRTLLNGFVNNTDLSQTLHDVAVVVLPSTIEGWGVIVNESLLMGKKVVISNRVGCNEYFAELNQVFVFEPDSNTSIGNALELALNYNINNNDYSDVLKLLDSDIISEKLEGFFENA